MFEAKPYPVKVCSTEEQGDKPRIITVKPGSVSTLLHLVRTWEKQVLVQDHGTGSFAGKGRGGAFIHSVNNELQHNGEPSWWLSKVILSADLKKATDTESPRVASSILEGVADGLNISDPLLRLIQPWVTMEGIIVQYPEDSGIPDVSLQQGVLMGNPASWPLLNWWNKFSWDLALCIRDLIAVKFPTWVSDPCWKSLNLLNTIKIKFVYRNYFDEIHRRLYPRNDPFTQRCGDDHISVCTPILSRIYETVLSLSGGEISPGAHMESKEKGVFTEEFLQLVENRVEFIDIIYIKSLVGPRSRLPNTKEIPISWTRGSAAASTLKWFKPDNKARQAVAYWTIWSNYDFITYMRKLKLEIYLPTSLGGRGFPYYKDEIYISSGKVKRALSYLLSRDESLDHLQQLESLASVWNVRMYSPLGKYAQARWDQFLADFRTIDAFGPVIRGTSSLAAFLQAKEPEYPNRASLKLFEETASRAGWSNYQTVYKDFFARIVGQCFAWYRPDSASDVPSLPKIAKSFHSLVDKICSGINHKFHPLRGSADNLSERLFWKKSQVWFMIEQNLLPDSADPPLPTTERAESLNI
jgi:hypothetical protein